MRKWLWTWQNRTMNVREEIDRSKLLLASVICHLAEYIESGHQIDLAAAEGLMSLEEVYSEFQVLHNQELLPHARQPVKLIQRMLSY